MSSMTDGFPVREPSPAAAVLAAVEDEWPQVVDDLAAVDATVRGHRGVDELAVRRARRASRRALRPARFVPVRTGGDAA